ncbi:hypothetical protein [Myxosarcina sp. GI1(2024)]
MNIKQIIRDKFSFQGDKLCGITWLRGKARTQQLKKISILREYWVSKHPDGVYIALVKKSNC